MQNEEWRTYPMQNENVESWSKNYYWFRTMTGEHQTKCRALLRFGDLPSKDNTCIMLALILHHSLLYSLSSRFAVLLATSCLLQAPSAWSFNAYRSSCQEVSLPTVSKTCGTTSHMLHILIPIVVSCINIHIGINMGMGAVPEGKKRVKGKK